MVLDCVDSGQSFFNGSTSSIYFHWTCEDDSLMMGYYVSNATYGCVNQTLFFDQEFDGQDGYCPDGMTH